MRSTRSLLRGPAAVLAASLVLTACGGTSTDSTSDTESTANAAATTGATEASEGATTEPDATTEPVAGAPIEVILWQPEGTARYDQDLMISQELEGRLSGTEISHSDFGGFAGMEAQQARLRSGEPAEVVPGFFNGAEVGPDLRFMEAGLLTDLSDAMATPLEGYGTTWEDAMLPAVVDFVDGPDGNVYAAPSEVTTLQFFYNAALFDELGLEVPRTWDELVEVARAIDESGTAPFAVTGTFAFYMQMYFDYLIMRHGGTDEALAALAGEGSFADVPGVDEAAADLEELIGNGWFLDGFEGTDFTAAQIAFFQGDAAMILMGSWLLGEMADSIPEGFEVSTFGFPTVDGVTDGADDVFGTVNVITVPAESEHPEVGVEWLRAFSEKDAQERRVEALQGISPYRDVAAPVGFERIVDNLNAGGAFVPSYLGFSATTDTAIVTAYQDPLTRLFFGEIDAAEMVSRIDDGLTAAYAP